MNRVFCLTVAAAWLVSYQSHAETLSIGPQAFIQENFPSSNVYDPTYDATTGTFGGSPCDGLQSTQRLSAEIELEPGDLLQSITCTVVDGDNDGTNNGMNSHWRYISTQLFQGNLGDSGASSQLGNWLTSSSTALISIESIPGGPDSLTFFPFDETHFGWNVSPLTPIEIGSASNLWLRFSTQALSITGSCVDTLQFTGCEITYAAAPPIDLCDGVTCDANASCEPVNGSCVCHEGFTGDGTTCSDLDECADVATNDCHADAEVCDNRENGEGYNCFCANGYQLDENDTCVAVSNEPPAACGAGQFLSDELFLSLDDYEAFNTGGPYATGVISSDGKMGYATTGPGRLDTYFYLPEGVLVTGQSCLFYDQSDVDDANFSTNLNIIYGGESSQYFNSQDCSDPGECSSGEFAPFDSLDAPITEGRALVGNVFLSTVQFSVAQNGPAFAEMGTIGAFGCTVYMDTPICQEIDECAEAPCQNNGQCIDGENSYTCNCPTMYEGDNCEFQKPQMVELQVNIPAEQFLDSNPSDSASYQVTYNDEDESEGVMSIAGDCPLGTDLLGHAAAEIDLPMGAEIVGMNCSTSDAPTNNYFWQAALVEASQPFDILAGERAPADFAPLPSQLPVGVAVDDNYRIVVSGYGDEYCAGGFVFQGCALTLQIENPCFNGGTPVIENGEITCDCINDTDGHPFGGDVCENISVAVNVPPEDFVADNPSVDYTYSNGVFEGGCVATLASATAEYTSMLQDDDRIEGFDCSFGLDGPTDPLADGTTVLGIVGASRFYDNGTHFAVQTLGSGFGKLSDGQQWFQRINLMPKDVNELNDDSYTLKVTQRVLGDDTSCVPEYDFEGCDVTVSREPSQTLTLGQGWNIISTYIDTTRYPEDSSNPIKTFMEIFAEISDKVDIAKNYAGQAYWPSMSYDGIGPWLLGQGYQIRMGQADEIVMRGPILQPEYTPITLIEGWNLIGYLRMNEADITEALVEVEDKVLIAKNNAAAVYWPEYEFNGIGNLVPGQGYQIKVTEQIDLVYQANHDLYPSEQ